MADGISKSESSKRQLEDPESSETLSKKPFLDDEGSGNKKDSFAKLLFPSYIAGLIIGKDGVEISNLMNRTGTVIKFSPGRELYPNTQERICCISGSISNIVTAIRAIFEKISASETVFDHDILGSLKMIVSNTASGIIIGKSGSTIKTIQQNFNVRIQLTNKEESKGLPERTMTITADSPEYLFATVKDILTRLLSDEEGEKWKKVLSYNSYTAGQQPQGSSSIDYSSMFQGMMTHPSYASTIQSSNGASVYQQTSTAESGMAQAMLSYMYSQSLMSNNGYFTRYAPVMMDGVNVTVPGATIATFDIAIPEVMINSVIGGNLISELMQMSGTRIQLSAKGDYIPGTYNRKLTVTGPILSVQSVHLTLMQNILRDVETYRKQALI